MAGVHGPGVTGAEAVPAAAAPKPKCSEISGTYTQELHKPSGIAVPMTRCLFFAGSTIIHACSLTCQGTFGEGLSVIKMHERRT